MARGGDRRPLVHSPDRSVEYGALLLQTMWRTESSRADLFRREYESLFVPYRRLLRALDSYKPAGSSSGPPGEMRALARWFELVQISFPVLYPRRRALTQPQDAELNCRIQWCQYMVTELTVDNELSGVPHPEAELIRIFDAIWDWVYEPFRPTDVVVRQRTSRRVLVRRFLTAVEAFARKWRLDAWWAVPALIHSYFVLIETGTPELMQVVGYGAEWQQHHRLLVQLPGTSAVQFVADREASEPYQAVEIDAAYVSFDWDPEEASDPGPAVDRAVEKRLDRRLTKRERRGIHRQLDEQVRMARTAFLSSAKWAILSPADLETHAVWLASYLFDRSQGWAGIARVDQLAGRGVAHPDHIGRSCRDFAENAQLTLP